MRHTTFAILVSISIVLIIIAIISEVVRDRKSDETKGRVLVFRGFFKVLYDVSVGALLLMIPVLISAYFVVPVPEDTMPSFIYSGTYQSMDDEISVNPNLQEELLEECSNRIDTEESGLAYYDRAYLYIKQGEYNLAIDDLLIYFNINKSWSISYDLGVAYGYLLDYDTAIQYLKGALNADIPDNYRDQVEFSLDMIQSYYYTWLRDLFNLA